MDEDLLNLIQFTVTNKMNPQNPPKTLAFTIPASSTIQQLRERICERTNSQPEWFDIELSPSKLLPTEKPEASLSDLQFSADEPNVLSLIATQAYKDAKKENPLLGADDSDISDYRYSYGSYGGTASQNYGNWNSKSSTGFVGLSNQGATCYLNSLIQTLYMTPEFRSAVYNWSFEDHCRRDFEAKLTQKEKKAAKDVNPSEEKPREEKPREEKFQNWKRKTEDKSIPRQLQKLFMHLQLTDKRACETKNLTNSFGWENTSEAFTQHDVQEVCRVLFDALEIVWQGTDKQNLIKELYQGEIKDYVRCLKCENESCRKDSFLDIPLVIKGFGETVAVSSVEEALAKFVEPETLSGDNQYYCDKCDCKVNAEKGLKFSRFPYLLTLQLKRFDFDFETLNRVKLNDRVTFPEILDLNQFIEGGKKKQVPGSEEGGEEMEGGEVEENKNTFCSDSERAQSKRQRAKEKALQNGPYVYELFSILVHRGSALGGHYYAYIKSFTKGKWYCFNDSSVTDIRDAEPKETFGGKSSSGMSAYMLMYRQLDTNRNQLDVIDSNISDSMRLVIDEENKIEEVKQLEQERQRHMIKLKLHYKNHMEEMQIHKDETMETATVLAAKALSLESYLPDNFRLRDRHTYYETAGKPFTGLLAKHTLSELRFINSKSLMAETKEPGEEFPEYDPESITIKISIYNSGTWSEHHLVPINRKANLLELKEILNNKFHIAPEQQVIVKDCGKPISDEDDEKKLKELTIQEGTKLLLEPKYSPEEQELQTGSNTVLQPRACIEINRIKNTIQIYYNQPGTTEYENRLETTKQMTLGELRKHISETLNLEPDSFKLMDGCIPYAYKELTNDSQKLGDLSLYTNVRITVEKIGLVEVKFLLFRPHLKEGQHAQHLFSLPLPGNTTVREAKEMVYNHFQKLQESEETKRKDGFVLNPPSNIRLRKLWVAYSPDRIWMDHENIKDIVRLHNEIAVQNLPLGQTEPKTSSDTVIIFLQQFHPETVTLGERFEFETHDSEILADFRKRMVALTGIQSLSWASADGWDGLKLLSIVQLTWTAGGTEEEIQTKSVHSLGLSDGDLLLFKDATVPLKELTEEERKLIQVDDDKKEAAQKSAYHRKEEQFKITIQDVEIDD